MKVVIGILVFCDIILFISFIIDIITNPFIYGIIALFISIAVAIYAIKQKKQWEFEQKQLYMAQEQLHRQQVKELAEQWLIRLNEQRCVEQEQYDTENELNMLRDFCRYYQNTESLYREADLEYKYYKYKSNDTVLISIISSVILIYFFGILIALASGGVDIGAILISLVTVLGFLILVLIPKNKGRKNNQHRLKEVHYEKYRAILQSIGNIYNSYNKAVPFNYARPSISNVILQYMESKRARSIKEAISLYEAERQQKLQNKYI